MGKKLSQARVTLDGIPQSPEWYVIVSKYNWEKRLAQDIAAGINKPGLEGQILEVVVPIKETVVTRTDAKGKTTEKKKEEKIYPLYVFVKCIMNDRVWNFIKNSEGSQTILAPSGTPTIMSEDDVYKIKEICGLVEKTHNPVAFEGDVGDWALVISGPCDGLYGPVTKVQGNKVTVVINDFPVVFTNDMLEAVEVIYD